MPDASRIAERQPIKVADLPWESDALPPPRGGVGD